ncbi:hypothetical protein [Gemmatimonas sp.]
MATSPLDIRSAILTPRQFRARLGAILDRIEEELEGTEPARAPIRRRLRVSRDDLFSTRDVNLLFPPTRAGVLGLVIVGLATEAEAMRVLAVPAEDIPPMVPQPAGTVAATWDGWPVWAAQPAPGESWWAQTPDGDVEIRHPDYLVTLQLGGAQYRARATELET